MSDNKKRLVFSILEFLQQSVNDGTIKADDVEGIEVAMQCIGESFGVDVQDETQRAMFTTKPATLSTIFDVFIKTQNKMSSKQASSAPQPEVPVAKKAEISEQEIAKAEELKKAGNKKVSEKDYEEAIKLYSQAIEINDNNSVYYANRAAAYGQLGDHDSAIADSIRAAEIDPTYVKAYSRMGHAYFSKGSYKEAVEAYEKGLELDSNNASMKSALSTARQKLQEVGPQNQARSAPGAGAGAGGLPNLGGMDFSSMMSNPAFMNMANQLMSNGGLERLLSNPNIAQMAQNMMGGGAGAGAGGDPAAGAPDGNPLADMMNNPELMNMARQFMGNQGGNNGSS
ncbi:Small glutamine-rich tetratricopeptide repeat-containing protein 2 [Basidiobolus ranarum]|uniref:Small glutamine-rich tetratricopeptide repeat-containing protein 2 n=1 Tax=Basidiobolus ranarum TaxID=34480 RepID=A0ABR2WXJ6_9FUNG